jgi:hypothetical protein
VSTCAGRGQNSRWKLCYSLLDLSLNYRKFEPDLESDSNPLRQIASSCLLRVFILAAEVWVAEFMITAQLAGWLSETS